MAKSANRDRGPLPLRIVLVSLSRERVVSSATLFMYAGATRRRHSAARRSTQTRTDTRSSSPPPSRPKPTATTPPDRPARRLKVKSAERKKKKESHPRHLNLSVYKAPLEVCLPRAAYERVFQGRNISASFHVCRRVLCPRACAGSRARAVANSRTSPSTAHEPRPTQACSANLPTETDRARETRESKREIPFIFYFLK